MKRLIYLLILSGVILLSSCSSETKMPNSPQQGWKPEEAKVKVVEESKPSTTEDKDDSKEPVQADNSCGPNLAVAEGQLKVHFKDVGQGDCILVQDGSSVMLIDAGDTAYSNYIVSYMKLRGISHIDHLIATHTHENHIGGMASIIDSFSIGTVYVSGKPSDSKAYKDMISALEAKKLKFSTPPPGTNFNVGETVCTVMAPSVISNEDENENSIVIRMVHGGVAFLLGSDAGVKTEKEMLARNNNISANVLKVSDHGKSSATSKEFLDRVKPQYAIVSVGDKEADSIQTVLSRLENIGAKIYKTDDYGTIILKSNKEKVNIEFDFDSGLT